MDIRFSGYDDPYIFIHVGICCMSLDRILSLIMALTLIVALVFIAVILHDLNNLWAESQELWEMFDNYWTIIKNQDDKIRNLQILLISKQGIGI